MKEGSLEKLEDGVDEDGQVKTYTDSITSPKSDIIIPFLDWTTIIYYPSLLNYKSSLAGIYSDTSLPIAALFPSYHTLLTLTRSP